MGGIAKDAGRAGLGVMSFGTSELANQALSRNGSGPLGQSFLDWAGNPLPSAPIGSTPFELNPAQVASDQAAINALGTSQDAQNQQYITQDAASRAAARDALAKALTTQGQAVFQQGLPQTEETLNAQHLLNGSGLGQEIARQQGYLATNIANQLGTQGALDINRTSDLKQQALQNLQGFGQSSLGRGLSLEDFTNQANLARAIGASAAPQVGNGKGQTGTLLGGIGGLAPLVKAVGKAGATAAGGPAAGAAAGPLFDALA